MPYYKKIGTVPRKRHIESRCKPGFRNEGIYYEEVVTLGGFGRAYSIVYHLRPPTRVRKIEPAGEVHIEMAPQSALRHHHIKTAAIPVAGDLITGRVPILTNTEVTLARCRPALRQSELYRNAVDDEVLFVQQGQGTLHTLFGPLPFKSYDYVVIPRCTTYRIEFDGGLQPDLLIIESAGNVAIPERYVNPDGQLRLGAPVLRARLPRPGPGECGRPGKRHDGADQRRPTFDSLHAGASPV